MPLTNATEAPRFTSSKMIPGQWEPGSLTRFAVPPEVRPAMVDVTINAATIADRQREGGGAARKRHLPVNSAHAARLGNVAYPWNTAATRFCSRLNNHRAWEVVDVLRPRRTPTCHLNSFACEEEDVWEMTVAERT